MIPTIKNYSCPFCAQKTSRRFNMEVHIKRRHRGMDLPLNNAYGAINATSVGYRSYNLKSNYSQNNAVFNDEVSVWRPTNRGNRQESFMDNIIDILSKAVQIRDLTSQFVSPYYPKPYSQQVYYPSTLGHFVQRSASFSSPSFHQSSIAVPAGSIAIPGSVSNKGDEKISEGETSIKLKQPQLISLRGSLCDKCLTIDTIPIFLYEDGTLNEIYNHSCSEDRVLDLKRRNKYYLHRFFVLLHRALPKILAINVALCNKSQSKISLYFMKHEGFPSSNTEIYDSENLNCPIRSLDAFPSEHRWINQIKNSQKQEDIIELETAEELLSFLEISINSTMVMLKIKHDSSLSTSSENWDSYLVGLNLPEPNLERVTKSFTPKFRN